MLTNLTDCVVRNDLKEFESMIKNMDSKLPMEFLGKLLEMNKQSFIRLLIKYDKLDPECYTLSGCFDKKCKTVMKLRKT